MGAGRRRGVRASRIRLERALAEANLARATQAALADRIADIEGLESPPKDMVSRMFRERPVDPQSIERVARALDVPAHSLYFASDDVPGSEEADRTSTARPTVEPSPPRPRTRRLLAGLALALAGLAAVVLLVPGSDPAALGCRLQSLGEDQTVAPDRLGVLVARFDKDPGNVAQRYLADRFLEDPALAPFVSVVTLCDRYRHDVPGDRRLRLDDIRRAAQARLAEHHGHVLLWGERDGDVLKVRLVSGRPDLSPTPVALDGRPVLIDERYVEVPLNTTRPMDTLPQIKKLALDLMQVGDGPLDTRRDAAVASYRGSAQWLKASVVTDRNLRASIRPEVDPTRWALVNAQLCYKYRLLGDIEANVNHYQAAVEACEAVLATRPRDQFPQEWAAVKTNLGSAWLRQHTYASSLDEALDRLERARAEIEAAAGEIDPERSPQLWAVNRRTLGTIYIRLGELSREPDAPELFDRGVAELEAALELLHADYQPLDWALTQQNICLALYQHGARLGRDGVDLVREAVGRCRQAAARLSPASSALSWGMVQNNVAASTAILAGLEGDPDLLERAADAFREAQQVYTRDRVPVNWAEVEVNLGELHCNLARLRGDPEALDAATTHTEAALRVFIEHGVARYARYAETLLESLDACDREAPESCRCGGA